MSKKIRVGVVGAGHWGPNLIRNFNSNAASELVAVADKSEKKRALLSANYPDVLITDDEFKVLEHPEIDAVVISTPTETHYSLAKVALENNKHVFCEKPLATTAVHCDELVEMADARNLLLFVGHVFVYNAGIQAVKKYIDDGSLGKILYIHSRRTNLGPVRTDVSSLWDLAPHDISIFNYWLGETPTDVSAIGGKFLGNELHDTVFATYSYPKGILAHAHVSWIDPHKIREIMVVGEKKMLVWNDMNFTSPVTIYDKNVQLQAEEDGLVDTFVKFSASIYEGDTLIPRIKLNEPLSAECNAFLQSISDRSKCLSSGVDGRHVVSILEATDESMLQAGATVGISRAVVETGVDV